jgi:hypothetical protein
LELEEVTNSVLRDNCNQLGAILYRLCQLPEASSSPNEPETPA